MTDATVIELQSVTKVYDLAAGPVVVLDDVDLTVPAGQMVALRGVSGPGKSTLLHLLGAIDRPTSGTVSVSGHDVGGLSVAGQADYRAKSVGFVFQFFNLMPTLTVAENVASGLEPLHWKRADRDDAVRAALASVDLLDQADKYPAQLSGGQQQRAAIARAVAKRPPVLLADEPTGALDQKTAGMVLEYLGKLRADLGCTVVIATHDPLVADFADTVYHVGGGRSIVKAEMAVDEASSPATGTRHGAQSPLLTHTIGSARSMWGRLLALVAITGACFGIFAGGLSAIDSTLNARDGWFAEGALADLEVRFAPVPSAQAPDFTAVAGVAAQRQRTIVLGTVDVPGNSHLNMEVVAGQADDHLGINKLVLLEGDFLAPDDTDGILIDWHLATSHGVKVGDSLSVTLGASATSLTVRGVVRDAEFLLAPADPTLFIPTKDSLGIGFVTSAALNKIDGVTPVNSVLLQLAPGQDRGQVRQAVLAQAGADGLSQAYALGPDEQFSSLYLEKNLAAFATVVPVIVAVTGLSSVFVIFFLLAQWLARERRAFGVLLTIGYTWGALARAFMVVLGVLAVASMALGVAVAYGLARVFVWQFATSVGIPLPVTALTGSYLWLGCLAIAVVFLAAGAYAAVQVAHMTPLDAIRNVAGVGRRPGAVSTWLGAHLPTSWLRVAARNTARDKAVSLLTVASMALGFGITASFFISFSSLVTTAQGQVSSSTWDLLADFRAPVDAATYTKLASDAGASDSTGEVRGAVQATVGSVHVNLNVGGYDPSKLWYKVPMMLVGQDIDTADPTGILIEISTANQLGVKIGDTVQLDSTSGHFEAHVIGTFSSALPGEARFTVGFAQQVFAVDGQYTGMLMRVPPGDAARVADALNADDAVAQVMTRTEISTEITQLSDQITSIVRVGSGVSVAVALLFVMACLGYTVLKRAPDYHLLRALGYPNRVVVATILSEVGMLGVAAVILAVPIGALVAHYTDWRISQAWFHVATVLTVADYAWALVPAIILLPAVALPMARTVASTPLDEYMRSRELG